MMFMCIAGPKIPLPSAYEVYNKYLEMEVVDAENFVEEQKKRWKMYGCTILADGWTGPTKLSIINIMVYCAGATVFLKSIDASKNVKSADYIYSILKDVLKEDGRHNVVQVVTDNGANYKSAG